MKDSTQSNTYSRIWLDSGHYVSVDHEGFIVEACYEGALGCVIPVFSTGQGRFALKVPRMLADTERENAFISEVLVAEAEAVHAVAATHLAGLVRAPIRPHATRPIVQLEDSRRKPEVFEQDRCILLFSFKKDRNPRVCAVKFQNETLVVFPRSCADVIHSIDRDELRAAYEHIREHGRDADTLVLRTIPRQSGDLDSDSNFAPRKPLNQYLAEENVREIWFAGMPSIVFDWATGTLQEAVSQSLLTNWTMKEHLGLCDSILRGIQTLHDSGLIHGDLRPANIMTCGKRDTPSAFLVGDYGSFSGDFTPRGTPKMEPSGHTSVAGLGRHRMSAFYALERRAGIERETADTGLILAPTDTECEEYLVYLGWRSEIIDIKKQTPRDALVAQLQQAWEVQRERENTHSELSEESLSKGDRLRVREWVFTILGVVDLESDGTVNSPSGVEQLTVRSAYRCHRRYARVYNERLTLFTNEDGIPDRTVTSLPNFIELRQWSAATDLYGVGTLTLYTVFMSAEQRSRSSSLDLRTDGARVDAETRFSRMIEALENKESLNQYWDALDDFIWYIEQTKLESLSSSEISRWRVDRPRPGRADLKHLPVSNKTQDLTLLELAKRILNVFASTYPDVHLILSEMFRVSRTAAIQAPQYQVAHFLMFVHFCLSCLHRRSHLKHARSDADYPFCRDRRAPPSSHAATVALNRLQRIVELWSRPQFDGLVVGDFARFDQRADDNIRQENQRLQTELEVMMRDRDTRVGASARLSSEVDSLKGEIGERDQTIENLRKTNGELEMAFVASKRLNSEHAQELKSQETQLKQSNERLDKAIQGLQDCERRLASMHAENASLRSKVARLAEVELTSRQLESENGVLLQRSARLETAEAELTLAEQSVSRYEEAAKRCHSQMEIGLRCLNEIKVKAFRVPSDKLEYLLTMMTNWHIWGQDNMRIEVDGLDE